jgi:Leucine-rich repeat (LRR) protein
MLLRVTFQYDTNPIVLEGDSLLAGLSAPFLTSVTAVEALVSTTDSSLCSFTDLCPRLTKLKLNNSKIASVRDIGCRLNGLTFLSLAHCGITSLDGISTISKHLTELHLAFNFITDVSDLMCMDQLKVLDLESNRISDISNLRFLTCCTGLISLTLAGNPAVQSAESYVQIVADIVPNLVYLDERRVRSSRVSLEERSLRHQDCMRRPVVAKTTVKKGGEEWLITEAINDKVNDRPPTSHAQKIKGRISPSSSTIKIVRPVSAQRAKLNGK